MYNKCRILCLLHAISLLNRLFMDIKFEGFIHENVLCSWKIIITVQYYLFRSYYKLDDGQNLIMLLILIVLILLQDSRNSFPFSINTFLCVVRSNFVLHTNWCSRLHVIDISITIIWSSKDNTEVNAQSISNFSNWQNCFALAKKFPINVLFKQ